MSDLQLKLYPNQIYSTNQSEKFSIFFTPIYGLLLENISENEINIDKICFKLVNSQNNSFTSLELSTEVLKGRNDQYLNNPQVHELLNLIFRNNEESDYANSFSLKIEKGKKFPLIHIWLYSPFVPRNLKINITYNENKSIEFQIPVFQLSQKNEYIFPVRGNSYIIDGSDLRSSNHIMFDLQSNGIDIVKLTNGKIFKDNFLEIQDHECFDKPVYSAAEGTVLEIQDNFDDNYNIEKILNSNLSLTLMQNHKNRLEIITKNSDNPIKSHLGNYVLIQHKNDEFSLYCHLKKNSIEVKENQQLHSGEIIARIGNSGSSIYPHLHFQVMDNKDILKANTIPIVFKTITGNVFQINRHLFTGDIIIN